MPLGQKYFYEFGSFRLEPSERLLLHGLEPVPLPPKAFETLLLLVRNSGHVLSKDELMRTLWPDTFVEENNLTQHISLLRRALGETQNANRYIETVPRLGYRFAIPVREATGDGEPEVWLQRRTRTHIVVRQHEEEETTETEAPEQAEGKTPDRFDKTKTASTKKWIALAALTAIAAASAYVFVTRSGRFQRTASSTRTVAILPFRELRPDPEAQFLSYSLADAIIHRLGYIDGIVVRPSSYVAKYQGGGADPRAVAKDLRVDAVLTGNYLREGDRLRVSAELVDVAKAEVLWRDQWEVPYGQLLTVQDRVAENVARGMRLQILPKAEARLKQTAPSNPLAYEYFLRGVRNYAGVNDYRISIEMLEKSVELDAGYAPAWMDLGQLYAAYAAWQGGGPAFEDKSRAAFQKALQLDPDMPDVHTFMAVHILEHGDLEKGVQMLRQELQLHPNAAMAHWWLTEAYLYGGMLEESIAEGERALELDPLVNLGSTFNSYLHAGDYQRFLSRLPPGESARTTFYRGLCYLYMQDRSRAQAEFEHAYALDPSLLHAKYGRAFIYAIRQANTEGVEYLKALERANPTSDGEMLYKMAQAYATLGESSSALRLFSAAISHNFYCYTCFLRDPLMTSLHGEPRYTELLELARDRQEQFRLRYF